MFIAEEWEQAKANTANVAPSPTPAKPKPLLAADAAVAALKLVDPDGRHNLVRIDPESGETRGKTFPPGSWDAIAAFVDRWNGVQNLYYSVNEPRQHSPDKKLGKRDIGAVRFIFVDKDPAKNLPFAEARADLEAFIPQVQKSLRPTLTLDSGGGFQFLWRLAEKLDPAEFETAVEEQGRGLAKAFGGDPVQNIDRILRLPGTTNLPIAEKRSRGQVAATARLVDVHDVSFTLAKLAEYAPPQPSPEKETDKDATVAAAMAEIDMAAARGVIDYADLPDELRAKFDRAMAGNPRLAGIWKGDEACLSGTDRSRSGWRASLAIALARCADVIFTAQDFAELVHAWPEQVDALDRIDKRDLARDWGRIAAPIIEERRALINRFFQEIPSVLTWIDPCKWEGQTPRPREWEVEGWIPRGEVTLLYGDGGIGKTLLAHQYATAAATGRSWLGQVTRPARVMGFFCEDSADELHRRQVDINASLGVSSSELRSMRLVSRKHEDNLLATWDSKAAKLKFTPLWHDLKTDAIAFGADVLIVDTLADVFGGSEIDRMLVNAFVKTCLGGLAMAIGGSVIALGHPSVSGKSTGTSGSTAWSNAARSRLYLKYPGKADRGDFRELEGMKLNYGPKGQRLKLRWNRGAFDMVAGSAPAMLRDSGAMAMPTLDDAAETAVVSALIDCAGAQMSVAKNSPYFAPELLKRRVPETLEAFTVQEVTDALSRLEGRGAIRMEVVGRSEHRKPINGYVVVPDKLSSVAVSGGDVFA